MEKGTKIGGAIVVTLLAYILVAKAALPYLGAVFGNFADKYPLVGVLVAGASLVLILGAIGVGIAVLAAATDNLAILEKIAGVAGRPFRTTGRAIATATRWLWRQAMDSPKKVFWTLMGILIGLQILVWAGMGLTDVFFYIGEWLGFAREAAALPKQSLPYPAFITAALILFAVVVGVRVWASRPARLAVLALGGVYFAVVIWPVVVGRLPEPAERLAVAKKRQALALLTGWANSEEAQAGRLEIQAYAEKLGRLVRVKEQADCLNADGSVNTEESPLLPGRVGRAHFDDRNAPAVIEALDVQEAVLVSFRKDDTNPSWAQQIVTCWVDAGAVEEVGVRKLLASAKKEREETAPSAARKSSTKVVRYDLGNPTPGMTVGPYRLAGSYYVNAGEGYPFVLRFGIFSSTGFRITETKLVEGDGWQRMPIVRAEGLQVSFPKGGKDAFVVLMPK